MYNKLFQASLVSASLVNSTYVYTYIYIYIEREREMCIELNVYRVDGPEELAVSGVLYADVLEQPLVVMLICVTHACMYVHMRVHYVHNDYTCVYMCRGGSAI